MKKQIFLTLSFLGLAVNVAPAMAGKASFTLEGIPKSVLLYVQIHDLPVAHNFALSEPTRIVPLNHTPPPGATPSVYIGDPQLGGIFLGSCEYQDADKGGNFAWYIKPKAKMGLECVNHPG